MAILTENIKIFVVQGLACFDTPSQIASAVKEQFGVEMPRQQVARYDPTKTHNKDVSPRLRAVFETARAKFIENVSAIPVAQRAYRLRALQRSVERAEQIGNIAMVASLLEQAAKEMGGMFTNRRELTGKDGNALAAAITTVTPEQLREAVQTVRDKY